MNWRQKTILSVASFMILSTNGSYDHIIQAIELDKNNVKAETAVIYQNIDKEEYVKTTETLISQDLIYDKLRVYYTSRELYFPIIDINNVKKIDSNYCEVEVFATFDFGTAVEQTKEYYLFENDPQEGWKVIEHSPYTPPEDWKEYLLENELFSCILKYIKENYEQRISLGKIQDYTINTDGTATINAISTQMIEKESGLEEIIIHGEFVLRKNSDSKWIVQSMKETSREIIK